MASAKGLLHYLAHGVVFGDGAMGTMLYSQGVFVNRCFDALNLESPDLVKRIHTAYIDAGVDFIETNTFGANALRLSKYGLADNVQKINHAAVEIALGASEGRVMVAGAVGPLGRELTSYGRLTRQQAGKMFQVQAQALVSAGVDFLILETFANTRELLVAIEAVAAITDIPVVAQMTAEQGNETSYGQKIDEAIAQIAAQPAVTAVGLNCSTGPSGMLTSLELIRKVTDKPISVQPNAGLPRRVEDRTLYMSTPEYMAEYAKRFYEKGAKIIGGCCGTTPDHIKEIIRTVRSLDRAMGRSVSRLPGTSMAPPMHINAEGALPLQEKSQLGGKLARGDSVLLIEMTPPRGRDVTSLVEKARMCAALGVDAINIPDGPRASARLSPLVTAYLIQQKAEIETVLHFCCRDRNLIGMQSDLLGAAALGLHNMLIITGDPPKLGEYPDATGVFDLDSIALTSVLSRLNAGIDIGGNRFTPGLEMTICVGANPVAADIDREIDRFKRKVEAGAEYAITQPVFDPESLFRFLDATAEYHIPIIAGIWPFTSFKNAEFMANEVPGVSVPDALLERMHQAATQAEGRRLGIKIAREMIEAVGERAGGFAVSAPFGNVKTALAVLGKLSVEEV